jgi:hypothetical protein
VNFRRHSTWIAIVFVTVEKEKTVVALSRQLLHSQK